MSDLQQDRSHINQETWL